MITILGGSGFIGSHLAEYLQKRRIPYQCPKRNEDLTGRELGDVVYAIGLTSDFRSRPFDTVEAHVGKLTYILENCTFKSLLYLSSTRVYGNSQSGIVAEDDSMVVNPSNPSDLYNLSKLIGESVALQSGKNTRVVRISNVYGDDFNSTNFLSSIMRDAVTEGTIRLGTSLTSQKDYISIDDVVEGIWRIVTGGMHRIYNLASGQNISNGELVAKIVLLTGCTVETEPNALTVQFPQISIQRMEHEFEFKPRSLLNEIATLVTLYQQR